MSGLTNSIKRAPKWTWYTATGLGLGAVAIKFYQNRGGKQDQPITNEIGSEVGSLQGTTSGGTPPGVIVPPVILGGSGSDPNLGVGPLQDLFMSGAQSIFGAWEAMVGPLQTTQSSLLMSSTDTISQIALAGAAPQSVGTPVVSAPPIPQPAPITIAPRPVIAAPPKPTAPKVEYENRTRDNGLSGTARKVWCNRVTIHRYPDGHGVVVGEVKIKNGAC